MPWKDLSAVDERVCFVTEHGQGLWSMSELCCRYGISRKTGYKWLSRAKSGEALSDRSRAPHRCPHRTPADVERAIVAERLRHPDWGPDKIRAVLMRREPDRPWPSSTTMGQVLKRHDLVKPRRRRRGERLRPERPHLSAPHPNAVWTSDFKGEFRMRDQRYCYPLTVADLHSRYLLDSRALSNTKCQPTIEAFTRLFQQYGLPEMILTDNGVPFAGSSSPLGLSRLNVWWMRLGIFPVRIQPGQPQQNGCHERMHRTLKAATTRPPGENLADQQRLFDDFRLEYNDERPHAALDQHPPASRYVPSPRVMPGKLTRPTYPGHYVERHVRRSGCIRWRGRERFLSQALAGEWVGLEEVDDQLWTVWLDGFALARLHDGTGKLSPVGFASRWPAPVGLRPPSADQREPPECHPCTR